MSCVPHLPQNYLRAQPCSLSLSEDAYLVREALAAKAVLGEVIAKPTDDLDAVRGRAEPHRAPFEAVRAVAHVPARGRRGERQTEDVRLAVAGEVQRRGGRGGHCG
jgi:hypothetical protein